MEIKTTSFWNNAISLLNQTSALSVQSGLVIYLLSRSKIILKLGKEYGSIENTDAGKAFSLLTGFSDNHLRQSLSEGNLKLIVSNKKNLNAVADAMQQIINIIDGAKKNIKDTKTPS